MRLARRTCLVAYKVLFFQTFVHKANTELLLGTQPQADPSAFCERAAVPSAARFSRSGILHNPLPQISSSPFFSALLLLEPLFSSLNRFFIRLLLFRGLIPPFGENRLQIPQNFFLFFSFPGTPTRVFRSLSLVLFSWPAVSQRHAPWP